MSRKGSQLISEQLNRHCFCVSLDADALKQALISELDSPDLISLVEERCPYLFSARPVFISEKQAAAMAAVIAAVETVVALPSYREHVLAHAPDIARHDPGGATGVFYGYDFHVADDRIGVIEINTNAGGAMLNAVMARAHHSCCLDHVAMALATDQAAALEQSMIDMFRMEWAGSQRAQPLRTLAIVDKDLRQQYLYPEFLLFQRMFERNGIKTILAEPSDFIVRDGKLMHGELPVDLVYNRLTDFMLEAPESGVLRTAYLQNAMVLTPHPQAHALYADKRNLALLSDANWLTSIGVPPEVQDVLLQHILKTEEVMPAHADRLWAERRQLFFKPSAGYGSRAAYRGDKLTKRVWHDILAGDYVAQRIMAPGERISPTDDKVESLKFDIRCYVYQGQISWMAARMYQGQTTNFRTPGGGFAPVYRLAELDVARETPSGADASTQTASCCAKGRC